MQRPALLVHVFAALLCCNPLLAAGQAVAAAAYAPQSAPCPTNFSLVREAGTEARSQSLSQGELEYISAKQDAVLPDAWKSYLSSVTGSANGSSLPTYVSDILGGKYGGTAYPRLGIAASGGGYRAATFGAGVLNALDGRNASAVAAGTGGLLQAATYLTGLSGGSWLVTSLVQANFPTIPDLVFGPAAGNATGFGGWNANFSLIEPSDDIVVNAAYVVDVVEEIEGKHAEGFPVTLSDVWARALSRHFANGTDAANFYDTSVTHGAGITLSSLSNLDTFRTYVQPFPILISDSLSSYANTSTYADLEDAYVPLTNPIYEYNIYEFGSYDPMLGAFIPMEYLGTANNSLCVTGYDQVCFIEALSASLFNEYDSSSTTLANSSIDEIIEILEDLIPQSLVDDLTVGMLPNPFQGLHPETFIDTNETYLQIVDGGEDDETVPLQPLLVQARQVDVIFAIDAASDTDYNWADGSSIIATQERMAYFAGTYAFPPVPPDNSTWLAEGLTTRPTFFGCNSSAAPGAPLLIYLGNGAPPLGQTAYTNTSTLQLEYSADELEAMLGQTFDVATQGIASETGRGWEKDPEYASCLACAVVDRARERQNVTRSGVCESCLERYCWS